MSLLATVDQLTKDQVFEAARFLARSLGTPDEGPLPAAQALTDEIASSFDEAEALARLLLRVAASRPELQESVRKAIAGAGRKNVVLTGGEVVALVGVLVVGMQVVFARGKSSEKIVKIHERDGKREVEVIDRRYGMTGALAKLISTLVGH